MFEEGVLRRRWAFHLVAVRRLAAFVCRAALQARGILGLETWAANLRVAEERLATLVFGVTFQLVEVGLLLPSSAAAAIYLLGVFAGDSVATLEPAVANSLGRFRLPSLATELLLFASPRSETEVRENDVAIENLGSIPVLEAGIRCTGCDAASCFNFDTCCFSRNCDHQEPTTAGEAKFYRLFDAAVHSYAEMPRHWNCPVRCCLQTFLESCKVLCIEQILNS
mmetsp:Transcript_23520/g.55485  ORF Transcript_23520/g.55485 Transcript_23520/m.55485 type:complete len:224 (-) Transcript_23520:174-845(-)